MAWHATPARLAAGAILAGAVALAAIRVAAPTGAVAAVPAPATPAIYKAPPALTPRRAGASFAPPGPSAAPAPAPTPAKVAAAEPIVIRHIIDTGGPLRFGEYYWDSSTGPAGPLTITIDLKSSVLSVFRGGYEIGTTAVIYGADAKQTPLGTFPILQKDQHHFSSTYHHAPMPYTLRLTGDGVSIHASEVAANYATHGCIGVPTGFAKKLFAIASLGDRVIITAKGLGANLARS